MKKFIITEDERKHIMGLYEQTVPVTPQTSGSTPTSTVKPDYRYIKTAERRMFKEREVTPTEKDYEDYRRGFNNIITGVKPKKLPIPSNEIRGAKEAKERGLSKK